jgi:hypothetical protein
MRQKQATPGNLAEGAIKDIRRANRLHGVTAQEWTWRGRSLSQNDPRVIEMQSGVTSAACWFRKRRISITESIEGGEGARPLPACPFHEPKSCKICTTSRRARSSTTQTA